MNDRPASFPPPAEPLAADIEAATRRLMIGLGALERPVAVRWEAHGDGSELASRIQALGADRSRLADELDGSLVKSRKLERVNREIAERLGGAVEAIRGGVGVGGGGGEAGGV